MSKPSLTVIGWLIALTIWAALAQAGGVLPADEGADRFNPAAAAASERAAPIPDGQASSNRSEVSDHDPFAFLGTVAYKDLEGGFFVIVGDDGRIYDPINLPETFQRDGLDVKVTAILRPDVGGIHMIGDMIEIVDITAE